MPPSSAEFTKFSVPSVDNDYGRGAIELTKKYLRQFKGEILTRTTTRRAKSISQRLGEDPRFRCPGAIITMVWPDTNPDHRAPDHEVRAAGKVPLIGNAESTLRLISKPRHVPWKEPSEPRHGPPIGTCQRARLSSTSSRRLTKEGPNNHAYVHWETVHLLAQAIKEAGSPNREKVREALTKIKYQSAVGMWACNSVTQSDS